MTIRKWLSKNWVWLSIMLGAVGFYFILHCLLMLTKNESILALTLIAIIWYSWETRGMKNQLVEQKELSLRPFVVIRIEPLGENRSKVMLLNLGGGAALNITLDKIEVYGGPGGDLLDVAFGNVDIIAGHHERHAPNADARDWHLAINQPEDSIFRIKYTDINNKPYFTSGTLGKGRVVFSGTGAL